jgi:hypothetical protein
MATSRMPVDTTSSATPIRVRAAEVPATPTTPNPVPSATDFASLPDYNAYLNMQKNVFENTRTNTLADMQAKQFSLSESQAAMDRGAEQSRRDLAGSFAKRGMMGGQGGAYARAKDVQNAKLVAAQTSTKAQIDALNRNFLSNFGTGQEDWTTTGMGRTYKDQAIQQALTAAQNRILGAQ